MDAGQCPGCEDSLINRGRLESGFCCYVDSFSKAFLSSASFRGKQLMKRDVALEP